MDTVLNNKHSIQKVKTACMLWKSFLTAPLTPEPLLFSPQRVWGRNLLGKVLRRLLSDNWDFFWVGEQSLLSALNFIEEIWVLPFPFECHWSRYFKGNTWKKKSYNQAAQMKPWYILEFSWHSFTLKMWLVVKMLWVTQTSSGLVNWYLHWQIFRWAFVALATRRAIETFEGSFLAYNTLRKTMLLSSFVWKMKHSDRLHNNQV